MLELSSSRRADLTATAERYHAELAQSSVFPFLEARGITEEMASQYLLGVVSDPTPIDEPYVGRLSIPFRTPSGVVAMRFRCVKDHDCKAEGCAKYLQPAGQVDRLYNVMALHERHPAVAIAEGELDALIVDYHVMPCVGITGASKWKKHWGRLLLDFEKVFLIGDGDSAGRKFVDKLTELVPNAQPVVMPKGLDANEFFLANGPEELAAFILGPMQ